MELKDIQNALESDNFETALQPAGEHAPMERLLVLLPNDDRDDLVVELLFIPGIEKEMESSKLLQFFVPIPCDIREQSQVELMKLLLKLNINLPLPAFGFHEEQDFVYYKYVMPLSLQDSANDLGTIVEAIWLIAYFIELYCPTIVATATGDPIPA